MAQSIHSHAIVQITGASGAMQAIVLARARHGGHGGLARVLQHSSGDRPPEIADDRFQSQIAQRAQRFGLRRTQADAADDRQQKSATEEVEKKASGESDPPGRDDPPSMPGQEPVREPTPAGDNVPGPIKEPERA
jgi:hypothetical protein